MFFENGAKYFLKKPVDIIEFKEIFQSIINEMN